MTAKDLKLEINHKYIDGDDWKGTFLGIPAMISPLDLDEDYWQFRVRVHDDQWINGFPKFNQIGIGFAKEDDWNTNLPSRCDANEIFNHIKVNKRYASIPDELCIAAIKLIQKAVKQMKKAERDSKNLLIKDVVPALFKENGKEISKKDFKERCHILRADRKARYASGEMSNVRKFCLYFDKSGREHFGYTFKAKMYCATQAEALNRFREMIREYALGNSDPAISWRNEEFFVSLPEEGKITGFKVALTF